MKNEMIKAPLGKHWLVEFYGCPAERLSGVKEVELALCDAAIQAGATIVETRFHQFAPWGVSGIVIIQESHLSIHTWPEHGFAAFDLFTCDAGLLADKTLDFLKTAFGAARMVVRPFDRGDAQLLDAYASKI